MLGLPLGPNYPNPRSCPGTRRRHFTRVMRRVRDTGVQDIAVRARSSLYNFLDRGQAGGTTSPFARGRRGRCQSRTSGWLDPTAASRRAQGYMPSRLNHLDARARASKDTAHPAVQLSLIGWGNRHDMISGHEHVLLKRPCGHTIPA